MIDLEKYGQRPGPRDISRRSRANKAIFLLEIVFIIVAIVTITVLQFIFPTIA